MTIVKSEALFKMLLLDNIKAQAMEVTKPAMFIQSSLQQNCPLNMMQKTKQNI